MARKILDGLPRSEVERLLGPADNSLGGRIVFKLGPERGFLRIDGEHLDIQLDASGKVTGYQLKRD